MIRRVSGMRQLWSYCSKHFYRPSSWALSSMDDVWLFVEHGQKGSWTRAEVPAGILTPRDMIGYLQRGGRVASPWLEIPEPRS